MLGPSMNFSQVDEFLAA